MGVRSGDIRNLGIPEEVIIPSSKRVEVALEEESILTHLTL